MDEAEEGSVHAQKVLVGRAQLRLPKPLSNEVWKEVARAVRRASAAPSGRSKIEKT